MGMTHSSSGKRGFEAYVQPTSFQFPKEILKEILIREDELRASEEYQQKYTEAGDDIVALERITFELQKKAIAEKGYANELEALTALHNARFQYASDPEMNQLTIYMRKDRCVRGHKEEFMIYTDVHLTNLDGTPTKLANVISNRADPEKPLVILSGSVS